MLDELKWANKWLTAGHNIVLAVVSETWGSAPRAKGSLMVIHKDGHFEGSVSGGCVEGSVISEATALMGQNSSKSLNFTVASEDAWQVGLACGGKIQIQLFPLHADGGEALGAAIDAFETRQFGELSFNKEISHAQFILYESTGTDTALLTQTDETLTLLIQPDPVLFIVGAVHIAQALTPIATVCGYKVTVIDPRGLFVEDRGFKGANIIHDWPDEFLDPHPLDNASALVTLTHDPKIDDAALLKALTSNAFYIGSLGSKKTHAARLKRLKNKGITEENLKRINGPVGLNIGSKTPAEIAVSIMAQITAARRGLYAV